MATKVSKKSLDDFLPTKHDALPVEEAHEEKAPEEEVSAPVVKKAGSAKVSIEGEIYDATGLPLGSAVEASSVTPERIIVVLNAGFGKWKKVGGDPWFPMPK